MAAFPREGRHESVPGHIFCTLLHFDAIRCLVSNMNFGCVNVHMILEHSDLRALASKDPSCSKGRALCVAKEGQQIPC